MEENKTNETLNNEEFKKDNNPLSVRVDPLYKEIFEDLINKKGISKKILMEMIISSYASSELDKEREREISFSNEISLISGLLEEILGVFNIISRKSQDTVCSLKGCFEQNIETLKSKIELLEAENLTLKEKNILIEAAKKGFDIEKEKLDKILDDLKQKNIDRKNELESINLKNTQLLEQINILRRIEKDNFILNDEVQKCQQEQKRLKVDLQDKTYEIETLKNRIADYENIINGIERKKDNEISELIQRIRTEAEIEMKTEILHIKSQYNEMQIENIKNLNTIHSKCEENLSLKTQIEQLAKELNSLKTVNE